MINCSRVYNVFENVEVLELKKLKTHNILQQFVIVSSTSKAAQCSATQNYKKVTAQTIKYPFELTGYAGAVNLDKRPEE